MVPFSLSLPPRHDGLIILTTNRPYDLDGAMHRRIMVAIEFRQPDHLAKKLLSLMLMCALESLATFRRTPLRIGTSLWDHQNMGGSLTVSKDSTSIGHYTTGIQSVLFKL